MMLQCSMLIKLMLKHQHSWFHSTRWSSVEDLFRDFCIIFFSLFIISELQCTGPRKLFSAQCQKYRLMWQCSEFSIFMLILQLWMKWSVFIAPNLPTIILEATVAYCNMNKKKYKYIKIMRHISISWARPLSLAMHTTIYVYHWSISVLCDVHWRVINNHFDQSTLDIRIQFRMAALQLKHWRSLWALIYWRKKLNWLRYPLCECTWECVGSARRPAMYNVQVHKQQATQPAIPAITVCANERAAAMKNRNNKKIHAARWDWIIIDHTQTFWRAG